MPRVVGSFWDSAREHWRALSLFAVLLGGMVLYSFASAPTVFADACGTQPDWWTLDYVTWLGCEATNGGPAVAVQAIASPVLDNIDTDLQGMTSTLNGTLGGLPGQIGSAVASALVPSSSDFQPLADEWQNIENTDAIKTVTSSMTAAQAFTTAMEDGNGAPPGDASVLPSGSYEFGGTTYSVGVPDDFMTGLAWFFAWLSDGGLSQAVLYGIEDAVFSLVMAGSILSDFGVHLGQVAPTVRAYDLALGSGAEEVRVNRAWRDFGRAKVWERHNKAMARDREKSRRYREARGERGKYNPFGKGS